MEDEGSPAPADLLSRDARTLSVHDGELSLTYSRHDADAEPGTPFAGAASASPEIAEETQAGTGIPTPLQQQGEDNGGKSGGDTPGDDQPRPLTGGGASGRQATPAKRQTPTTARTESNAADVARQRIEEDSGAAADMDGSGGSRLSRRASPDRWASDAAHGNEAELGAEAGTARFC